MVRSPYGAALRLCLIAEEWWPEIDAHYYQADIIRFRPHRFLNMVYVWCLTRIDPDALEEWHHNLNRPLPGSRVKDPSLFDVEDAGRMFNS